MELERLPADVLQLALRFLTGYDAFYLSHASPWLLRLLSDARFWKERLSPAETCEGLKHNWKERYMQARSLGFVDVKPALPFPGGKDSGDDSAPWEALAQLQLVDAAGAKMNRNVVLYTLRNLSFSFDLWFALLPATVDKPAGGIIYGMQPATATGGYWPSCHEQIVVVDSKRNLYCSLLEAKEPAVRDLEVSRWHHLALTYDFELQRELVYVDGVKVSFRVGRMSSVRMCLQREQIGTGCITAGGGYFPHPGAVGWYSFHGVISDFRLRYGVLGADDVAKLAKCGDVAASYPHYTLRPARDTQDCCANALSVSCTRPAESKFLHMEKRQSLVQ